MKRTSADVAFFLIGGRSVLGTRTTLDYKRTGVFVPSTPLGVGDVTKDYAGVKDFSLTQDGFFDDAVGSIHDALVAAQGTNPVVCMGLSGNVVGRLFQGFSGPLDVEYGRADAVKDLTRATGSYQGAGVAEDGRILHALGAETAAGNSQAASIDNGAATAAGGAGYLQVVASVLGGFTALVVKLRHSADNVTFADLGTFSNVTVAPTAERITFAGTVNRYLAAAWSWTGAGAGESATFVVGVVRN